MTMRPDPALTMCQVDAAAYVAPPPSAEKLKRVRSIRISPDSTVIILC
jgi:hypothetical protein